MKKWCDFHDMLDPWNSNHVPSKKHGTILILNLYVLAKFTGDQILKENLKTDTVTQAVVNTKFKCIYVSCIITVYGVFDVVMKITRLKNETFGA